MSPQRILKEYLSMKIEGIDHVQIAAPCDSEDMLRQFYVGLLGFEEIEKPVALKGRGGVWFNCGNTLSLQ